MAPETGRPIAAAERTARATRRLVRAGIGAVIERSYGHLAEGVPIWERDWDVLCLLDACRTDLMRRVAAEDDYPFLPDPQGLESVWSVGSQSAEWMDETFAPEYQTEMASTAYVTGNPFSAQACEHMELSGDALPLDPADFGVLHEAWRDRWVHADISTIPPGPLTDAAIDLWRRRDALGVDRLIVHYMQPHAPYRSRPEWFYGNADLDGWGVISGEEGGVGEGLWQNAEMGDLRREELWAAYRDNLHWVLDDVWRLLENCAADVVLTSDHGNAHGEWGVWSHPPGVSLPALRRVPWVELEGHDARTCDPDPVDLSRDRTDGIEAEERLVALGYR